MRITPQNAGRIAALTYTLGSMAAAVAFAAVAVIDGYDEVAVVGGAGWVFLLTMIILMPTVTPWIRAKARGG